MIKSDDFSITITSRHEELNESFKDSVRTQILKLAKYYPTIMDAKVIIDRKNTIYKVDISLQVPGSVITGKNEGYEIIKTTDIALEKVKNQIKKLRNRVVDHKAPPILSRLHTVEVTENPTEQELDTDQ
jgi:ribosomal subunit interface protein